MTAISIMITTKNRLEDLQRTIRVLGELSPPPMEILITADGCSDGTVEYLQASLPGCRLFINEIGIGSVASRDRMIREAAGDLVFSLDDDSYPEQRDCLAVIDAEFHRNPHLAVLHFPQHTDEYPETLARDDFGDARPTKSFANSGAVIKRSAYLQLAGFEPKFFHMYEEPDYALQCVAAGYAVYFSPVITIRHHFSSQARSEIRNHHRHSRNELWSVMMRCPFPYVMALLGYRMLTQFGYAIKRGPKWILREPVWWGQAFQGLPSILRKRNAVPWAGYKNWLNLQ